MKEIRHQTQTLMNSCVATSVAMIVDCPANEVNKFNDAYHAGEANVETMLAHYGVCCERMHTDDAVIVGYVYLVLAVSISEPGRFHMVVLDARTMDCVVYDPAKGFKDGDYEVGYYYWPEGEAPERKGVPLSAFIPVCRIKGEGWTNVD